MLNIEGAKIRNSNHVLKKRVVSAVFYTKNKSFFDDTLEKTDLLIY